jgi:hypothetical protein
MSPDLGTAFASAAGVGLLLLVLAIIFVIAMAALCLWILYTVIWRAVARGLEEFHHPDPHRRRRARRSLGYETPAAPPTQSKDWSLNS